MSADSEGDRQDGWHGDGDATNREDEDVVETITVSVVVNGAEDKNLEKNEGTDDGKTEGTNLGEDILQMTGGVVVLADQRGGTSEESVCTGRDDDTLLLTGRATGETKRMRPKRIKQKPRKIAHAAWLD